MINKRLDVADMLAAASAETGLTDFGDEEFREALDHYIDSSNNDVVLTPIGIKVVKAEVHRILVNRLRFAEDLKLHPEILDEDVDDPILILGMPRTGTTKLQRMLAADPDVQRLEYWRMLNPAPFPDAVAGQEDPRIEAARQAIAMAAQMLPMFMQSHPQDVHEVDEEVFLQTYTFKSRIQYMARPVPGYQAWMNTQSLRGTYRYMKQLLQYLQWQDGGKRNRPWIMKSPVHLGETDLLVEQFPKATLVFTHRDSHQVVPSHCRLLEGTWRLFCDPVDMNAVGQAGLHDFKDELLKHLKIRDRMGAKLEILDVQYEDIRNDTIGLIRKIYAKAGRELLPRGEEGMLDWERSHPQHPSGKPDYQLADYGVTHADIDAAFKEYSDRFGH